MDIGVNLKNFRSSSEMSLRELAKKSGCSLGVLSKIERNGGSPSLRTIEKICSALGVTVSDFLRPPANQVEKPLLISRERETCGTIMKWHGAQMLRIIPDDKINFSALIMRLEPQGCTSSRHSLISHTQVSFVLKGEVALQIENESYIIRSGEGIYFNTVLSHSWCNLGDEIAEILTTHPYRFTLFEQDEENLRWWLRRKKQDRQQRWRSRPRSSRVA